MNGSPAACDSIALTPEYCAVAATLHTQSGFDPAWDADSFGALLAMPGTAGRLALIGPDRAPAGLVLWRVAADEAEILTLCVAPRHRRRALARLLLSEAIAALEAAEVRRLILEVAEDNDPAIGLYRALNFVVKGRRPGYYRHADGATDALIMSRGIG